MNFYCSNVIDLRFKFFTFGNDVTASIALDEKEKFGPSCRFQKRIPLRYVQSDKCLKDSSVNGLIIRFSKFKPGSISAMVRSVNVSCVASRISLRTLSVGLKSMLIFSILRQDLAIVTRWSGS